jgi:hypothetical protein
VAEHAHRIVRLADGRVASDEPTARAGAFRAAAQPETAAA